MWGGGDLIVEVNILLPSYANSMELGNTTKAVIATLPLSTPQQ